MITEHQRTSTSSDLKGLDCARALHCAALGSDCDRCDLRVGLDRVSVTGVASDQGGDALAALQLWAWWALKRGSRPYASMGVV